MTQSTSKELVSEMIRMYDEGQSVRTIGQAVGKSYGYVHRALEVAGVTFRSRGGARKKTSAAAEAR